MSLSIELTPEIEAKLVEIAKEMGKSKSDCVKHAVEEFLEDWDDYKIAIDRLENEDGEVDFSEVKRRLGLED